MLPKAVLIAIVTIVWRDLRRYPSIWIQTFVPPIVMTALYFLVFGKVVGSRLGSVHGYAYIAYIMPGLVIMPVIMGAYGNGSFNFFIAKLQRNIELLLLSPMSDATIVTGFMLCGIVRGLVIAILVYVVSFLFVHVPLAHVFLALFVILTTASLFALLGCWNGIVAKNFESISIVPTFVLTPLVYLGGVFYAIALLPTWAQFFSLVNPIYYIVSAFKYALLGVPESHLALTLLILVVFNGLAFVLTYRTLRRSAGIRA